MNRSGDSRFRLGQPLQRLLQADAPDKSRGLVDGFFHLLGLFRRQVLQFLQRRVVIRLRGSAAGWRPGRAAGAAGASGASWAVVRPGSRRPG